MVRFRKGAHVEVIICTIELWQKLAVQIIILDPVNKPWTHVRSATKNFFVVTQQLRF
jgi:hypothetical protein